jgi:phosphoribosylaminoimidazole-succinocarboxamide synthase
MMGTITELKLAYKGSVKNVFQSASEPDFLWFQFTDDYSVFDWGKMPDQIANKGKALALMGAYLFEELQKKSLWNALPGSAHLKKFNAEYLARRWQHQVFGGTGGLKEAGLSSHFVQLVDDNQKPLAIDDCLQSKTSKLHKATAQALLMKVMRAQVNRPDLKNIANHSIYFYDAAQNIAASKRLIPLEVIFRFGMSAGSSLTKRLSQDSHYARELGLTGVPKAGEWFDRPVIEFFTKLEAKDRLLSFQEAALLAQLDPVQLEQLVEKAQDIALALHHIFAERRLELWDGKLEFVLDTTRQSQLAKVILADSIGPDELRVIYRGQQMSKELLRQYYRDSAWLKALRKAQEEAKDNGRDWKDICLTQMKLSPAPLGGEFKDVVNKLYGALANCLIGKDLFANQSTLDEIVDTLENLEAKGKATC